MTFPEFQVLTPHGTTRHCVHTPPEAENPVFGTSHVQHGHMRIQAARIKRCSARVLPTHKGASVKCEMRSTVVDNRVMEKAEVTAPYEALRPSQEEALNSPSHIQSGKGPLQQHPRAARFFKRKSIVPNLLLPEPANLPTLPPDMPFLAHKRPTHSPNLSWPPTHQTEGASVPPSASRKVIPSTRDRVYPQQAHL